MSKITNEQKYKTIDERVRAFDEFCNAKNEMNRDCIGCKLHDCDRGGGIFYKCLAHWLALEADEEKPEQCFYCGGKVHLDDNGPMLFYIQCNCGYRSRDFTRRDIAIAEHNRVARAVMASKKK